MTTKSATATDDVFDIRDKIERFEELETTDDRDDEDEDEMISLATFLAEIKDSGGDHEWRGASYPVMFIADDHFEDYAQELAEDSGLIDRDATWPNDCIDWQRAAEALQQDYSSVEYKGTTYWYRE